MRRTKFFQKKLLFSAPFFAFLGFIGCTILQNNNLKDYYFPHAMLHRSGDMVYVFKSQDPKLPIARYWYLHARTDSLNRPIIVAISFRSDGLPVQKSTFRIDSAEVRLVDLVLVEYDLLQKPVRIRAEIRQPYVFNLALRDTHMVLYAEVVWTNPLDSMEYTLTKVRKWKGFSNDTVLCARHNTLRYDVIANLKSFRPDKGETDSAWPEREYYAESIGLYRFVMEVVPGYPEDVQLVDIVPAHRFESRYHIDLSPLRRIFPDF